MDREIIIKFTLRDVMAYIFKIVLFVLICYISIRCVPFIYTVPLSLYPESYVTNSIAMQIKTVFIYIINVILAIIMVNTNRFANGRNFRAYDILDNINSTMPVIMAMIISLNIVHVPIIRFSDYDSSYMNEIMCYYKVGNYATILLIGYVLSIILSVHKVKRRKKHIASEVLKLAIITCANTAFYYNTYKYISVMEIGNPTLYKGFVCYGAAIIIIVAAEFIIYIFHLCRNKTERSNSKL